MVSVEGPEIGRRGAYAKGVARREEILDRAIEVFQQRGSHGTSLRRIAEAIGVSHAALLHYFDSREQLLVAVYDRAARRRDADPTFPEPESAVDVMIGAATANAEVPGLVELYSTLVAAAVEAESVVGKEYFSARFERVRGELADRIRQEQADGRVRTDIPPEHAAALIIAASDGLQLQWLLEPSLELRATLESLARVLSP